MFLSLNVLVAYKRFTELNPESAEIYKLIACLCYNLKRYGDALVAIEKVTEMDPNDKFAIETMREILRHLSNPGIFC